MTYIVTDACIKCKYMDCVALFTLMSALIAVYASLNARLRRSNRILKMMQTANG